MTKHTPGPWKCGEDEAFVYALNAHGSNRFFAGVQAGWLAGEPVEGRTDHAELMANARLISAAPDLLEALEIVRDMATAMRGEDFNLGYEQWKKVHAAIKKASGTT